MKTEHELLESFIDRSINELTSKYDFRNIKSIAILACVFSKDKNYNISQDLFIEFINQLRKIYSADITLLEKYFSDTQVDSFQEKFFKEHNLIHHLITKNSLIFYENNYSKPDKIYEGFYIDPKFIEAELKIVITNGALHKHHSDSFNWGSNEELALSVSTSEYDWTRTKRKDAIKVLRTELSDLYEELISIDALQNIYGIVDARNMRLTNEHLPFLNRKIDGKINFEVMRSNLN